MYHLVKSTDFCVTCIICSVDSGETLQLQSCLQLHSQGSDGDGKAVSLMATVCPERHCYRLKCPLDTCCFELIPLSIRFCFYPGLSLGNWVLRYWDDISTSCYTAVNVDCQYSWVSS